MFYSLAETMLSALHRHAHPAQIVCKGESVSAHRLTRQVQELAGAFSGIAPEQRALLLLKDKPAFHYIFLALATVGIVPVPVNPRVDLPTLEHILLDSRAVMIIVDPDELERVKPALAVSPFLSPDLIFTDDPAAQHSVFSLPAATAPAYYYRKPNSIAFWQYTSGTTGKPKAVQHSQEAMLAATRHFAVETLGIGPQDRIYSVPKMFFGYGLGNSFFFPLLTGAGVLLDDAWPTIDNIAANIHHYRPTVFFGVPKVYAMLLKQRPAGLVEALQHVRIFFSAGSTLPASLYEEWKAFTGKPILDGIGSTETGHVFLSNSPASHTAGSTGKPVSGYQLRLEYAGEPLSDRLQVGELCVRSPYALAGYWEDPVRTNQKFRDGWYYTGDLFSMETNGTYTYFGRKDELFKSNGRWVNPLAFESALLNAVSDVEECVLLDLPDDENLTCTLLLLVGKADTRDTVTQFINECTESHYRPREMLYLPELPRNANGKLSRTELRTHYQLHFQPKKN
ncbi:AMP-binding protein [Chitinophaga oryzae]|uniref:AMP-binding protein n=1 Tax=Chitinophaga oryzae TaxID=2725414 RepID=A0ABX6LBD5_9BACT|nr:AMP-binding protein [Chitinophaga oryzae]QJB37408.1 AMP-binding protein [Chitinophaga oryzae]